MTDSTLPSPYFFLNKILACWCCTVEILKGFFFPPKVNQEIPGKLYYTYFPLAEELCGNADRLFVLHVS